MKRSNILQLNNTFIQKEQQKRQTLYAATKQKNRFMGAVLILVMCLFILPTYNLIESYANLLKKEEKYAELKEEYQKLAAAQEKEAALVTRLKDEDYAAKYVRAKYQYSKYGEFIYNIPGLLPK